METLARLLDFLFPRADSAERIAKASAIEFGALLCPRTNSDGTVSLLPYRHSLVRAAILEAKFHRNAKAFALLGNVLREYLSAMEEDTDSFEAASFRVVPVPLSTARRYARGYNQVEEVAKVAGVPLTQLLERVRDTPPQSSLTRARRLTNMEGAFRVHDVLDPMHFYIVLDDVLTTGTTLASAMAALRAAGARNVTGLALAH